MKHRCIYAYVCVCVYAQWRQMSKLTAAITKNCVRVLELVVELKYLFVHHVCRWATTFAIFTFRIFGRRPTTRRLTCSWQSIVCRQSGWLTKQLRTAWSNLIRPKKKYNNNFCSYQRSAKRTCGHFSIWPPHPAPHSVWVCLLIALNIMAIIVLYSKY